MEPFIYGNKKIEFTSHSGEVVGYDSIVKTHVRGSGGGGTQGNTAPIRISSRNEVIQKFFLKDVNNQETWYTLTDKEIPLHDGQKITVISGSVDGMKEMAARIVNQNANRFWNAESGMKLAKNWGLIKERTGLYFIGGFLASLVIASLLNILFWIMFAGTLLYCVDQSYSNVKIAKQLDEHINKLARGVLGNP